MSDRRRFLKGLTSLPLATVLANPRLAAGFPTTSSCSIRLLARETSRLSRIA